MKSFMILEHYVIESLCERSKLRDGGVSCQRERVVSRTLSRDNVPDG